MSGGHPVQIVSLVDIAPSQGTPSDLVRRRLQLDQTVLREITRACPKDCPIAVVGIAGAVRRGKSFILSYLVRYLTALEESEDGSAGDWMDRTNPTASMKDIGFNFQNAIGSVTNGIWLWSKPFIVQPPESATKSKIAILLMDTQGCFDSGSSEAEESAIIGISLLTSSSFIFNESLQLNENTLTTLGKYMQFGQLATQTFHENFFQRLIFLIRDWNNPDSYPYGAAGGQKFIREHMTPTAKMAAEAVENRQFIQKSFESFNCYLMPFPGRKAILKKFTGSIAEMDKEFADHVEHFAVSIVADAVPKKITNAVMTSGSDFFHLMYNLVEAFNSDELPSPDRILRATIYSAYEVKLSEQKKFYEGEMSLEIQNKPFLPPEAVQGLHENFKREALAKFIKVKTFTNDDQTKSNFYNRLAQEIDDIFKRILTQFQERQGQILTTAESKGVQSFSDVLTNLLGEDSPNDFWSRNEFDEFALQAETAGVETFLEACSPHHQPPEQFVFNFIQKLDSLKLSQWDTIEKKVMKAEAVMEEIGQELIRDYVDDMENRIDHSYTPSKKLREWHDKNFKIVISSFKIESRTLDYKPSFLDMEQKKIEKKVEAQFQNLVAENEKRKQKIEDLLQKIVDEAIQLLTEEAIKILDDLRTASPEALREKHKEILEDAEEFLKRGDSTTALHFYKIYAQKLVTETAGVLETFLGQLAKSGDERKRECEKIVQSFTQMYQQQVNSILLTAGEDYFDELQLISQLAQIENQLKPAHYSQIQEWHCAPSDEILIQTQLDIVIRETNQGVREDNQKRAVEAQSQADALVHRLIEKYEAAIEEDGTGDAIDVEGLEALHTEFLDTSIRELESSIRHRDLSIKSRERVKEQLGAIFDKKMKVVRSQQEVINEASMVCIHDLYERELKAVIAENPFLTDNEVKLKEGRIFQETVKTFQDKVGKDSKTSPRNLASVVCNFRSVLKAKKNLLQENLTCARQEAEAEIKKIQQECVDLFAKQVDDLQQKPMMTSTDFDIKTTTLVEQTATSFEDRWKFPPGPRKEDSTRELKKRLRQHIKNIQESEEVKELYANQVQATLLENCGSQIEATLADGQFMDTQSIKSQFDHGLEDMKQNFQSKLQERGVTEIEKKVRQLESIASDKLGVLLTQNLTNFEQVKVELDTQLETFGQEKLSQIKSSGALVDFKSDLETELRTIIQEKFAGQNFSEFETSMAEIVQKRYDEIYQALLTKSETKISKIKERAKTHYQAEMTKLMRGLDSVHPDHLAQYDVRCVGLAIKEIEKKYVVISDQHKYQVYQILENSFRILREKNDQAFVKSTSTAIGIDLGTTTCCVSVVKDGKPIVIQDAAGNNLTASYVHYPASGVPVIGHVAKEQAQLEPENVVYDAKRLIGRQFLDDHVQKDMRIWPFKVIDGGNGRPKIEVRGVKYLPEEVSAHVLMRMKKIAEDHLRREVTEAVITVPANFNDAQRDATRQAAEVAGLKVLQILNEPTAAAIAHAITWKDEERIVLVFDFGGGTFDVSIVKTGGVTALAPPRTNKGASSSIAPISQLDNEPEHSNGGLQVLTTLGDTHLGGEDVDGNLVDYCVGEMERMNPPIMLLDIPDMSEREGPNTFFAVKRRQRRLKNECERVKTALTTAETVTACIENVYGDLDLNLPITRALLEQLNLPLFQKAMDIVKKAIDDARITKDDVTDVILVGGSSRIPKVQDMLKDLLGQHNIVIEQEINIQESVAKGAAIQASILSGGALARAMVIKDVQPFSLGIEVLEGNMSVIIPRNSEIPFEGEATYVTTEDDQLEAAIHIFSGEDKTAANNSFLGSFTLTEIPRGFRGSQKLRVQMKINTNGILEVTATCVSNRRSQNLVIEESRGRLSEEQIQEIRERLMF